MRILLSILLGGTLGAPKNNEASTCGDPEHELSHFCKGNDDPLACDESLLCEFCPDTDSCYVSDAKIDACNEKFKDEDQPVMSCIFSNAQSHLAPKESLNEEEVEVVKSVVQKIDVGDADSSASGAARSGFLSLFNTGGSFGQVSAPMMPYDMMSVNNRLSAQFITCPVNVPFCQRQECTSSIGNPQNNAMDCYRIAGCCFDNDLFVYKTAFGQGLALNAPVCYRAIRTPLFHVLTEQITTTNNFLPNFLVPIVDKVEAFINNDKSFSMMLEYHQCLSTEGMAPSRLRLESYLSQVWPGYLFLKMGQKDNNFLDDLVITLSQTCGWRDITKSECMLIGCCYNPASSTCTHPTDLTKIDPQKLVATATWMLTYDRTTGEDATTTQAPTTTAAPVGGGLPPIFNNDDGRSGAAPPGWNPSLFAGLSGRRRRAAEKRNSRKRRQLGAFNQQFGSQFGGGQFGGQQFGGGQQMNVQQMAMQMLAQRQQNKKQQGGEKEGRFGLMQPNLLSTMMMNNQQTGGSSLFGAQGGGLSSLLGGLTSQMGSMLGNLGGMNNQLSAMMGVNSNPFLQTGGQETCPVLPGNVKLSCLQPPSEDQAIDAIFLINEPKRCEVKGCCWDQSLMKQLLLTRNSDSLDSFNQLACPWIVPKFGSSYGFPDLTKSIKGCCDISPCVHKELPADWTLWGEWTPCTKLCGGGESSRSRTCVGNGFCPGMVDDRQREQIVSKKCNMNSCESWASWSAWSTCSQTCGQGSQETRRSCIDVRGMEIQPPGESRGCKGNGYMTKACFSSPCPQWQNWMPWSTCSVTCGVGESQRIRMCNLPGRCAGPKTERKTCGSACYSNWSMWTACSKSCYGGTKLRSRECMYTAETGKQCSGESQQQESCNTGFCEQWVQWSQWSTCQHPSGADECGQGSKLRSRECTGALGAPGCQGNPYEEAPCETRPCQWSDWQQSSACSATCGEGQASFIRSCEKEGQCEGLATATRTCIEAQCPGWQPWSEWGECSVTCGSGRKTKTRTCNGRLHYDCRGSLEQVMQCNEGPCNNGMFPNANSGWNQNYNMFGQSNTGYNNGYNGYNNQNNGWSNANFFGGNTGGDVMDSGDNTNPWNQFFGLG
ncbi:Oidioi.mRNA.OKI2018_I69.XSR.g14062.t1.cds [Oikopleura dioica]|uniref:Oidioi.mRNA.OKI2018_I69.XSR.g14062.t1.cds n=1 Tax=Oikopleura dioica TaxID=34765 RepID=A0ABN7SDK8_OIKDI|nr:Oidioi.mRNA.OKI2018_I69.XSR.g14062.t1.cds [Oikopleura dioica]